MVVGTLKLHNNWGFLVLPHDLGRMYRWLFLRDFGTKLQRPSNQEHVTLVSPWDKRPITDFQYLNGQEMKVEIKNEVIWTNGNAIWLDVVSEDIDSFRASIGLGKPSIELHYCIGYRGHNEDFHRDL